MVADAAAVRVAQGAVAVVDARLLSVAVALSCESR
jgi:hypothetical protein